MSGPVVCIGTPLHGMEGNSYNFRRSLDSACTHLVRQGITFSINWVPSSLLVTNRNQIVKNAIEVGAQYLMMFDSDQMFNEDIITRLMAHRKPIVSALYFTKSFPVRPLMLKQFNKGSSPAYRSYVPIYEWKENDLIKVDAAGAGAMLVEVAALKRMQQPWFCCPPKYFYYDGGLKRFRIDLQYWADKEADKTLVLGEDVWFCELARAAGFDIYVDTSVLIGHIGTHVFGFEEYENSMKSGELLESWQTWKEVMSHEYPDGEKPSMGVPVCEGADVPGTRPA